MGIFNNINTIISVVAGLLSIFAAIKSWIFKNETKDLQRKLLTQLEIDELILNLNLCLEKISKLPRSYQRGFVLQKEIVDIQSLLHKSTSLAIAENEELFVQGLNAKTAKWIDELNTYQRNYESTKQNSDLENSDLNLISQENISRILNFLQSEISSIISKCKQNF